MANNHMIQKYIHGSTPNETVCFRAGLYDAKAKRVKKTEYWRATYPVDRTAKAGTNAEDFYEVYDRLPEGFRPAGWERDPKWWYKISDIPALFAGNTIPDVLVINLGIWLSGKWLCRCDVFKHYHENGVPLRGLKKLPESQRVKVLKECAPIDSLGDEFTHAGYVAERQIGKEKILVPCNKDICPFRFQEIDGVEKEVCGWFSKLMVWVPWVGRGAIAAIRTGSTVSIEGMYGSVEQIWWEKQYQRQRYTAVLEAIKAAEGDAKEALYYQYADLLADPPPPPSLRGTPVIVRLTQRSQIWQGTKVRQPLVQLIFNESAQAVQRLIEKQRYSLSPGSPAALTAAGETGDSRFKTLQQLNEQLWNEGEGVYYAPGNAAKAVFGQWIRAVKKADLKTENGQMTMFHALSRLKSFHEFYKKQQARYSLPESPLSWITYILQETTPEHIPVTNWFQLTEDEQELIYVTLSQVKSPLPVVISDITLGDKTAPDETAPDETAPDETVPDETVPDETVPDETVPDETAPDETERSESFPIK